MGPHNALAKLQGQEGKNTQRFIRDLDGRHDRLNAGNLSASAFVSRCGDRTSKSHPRSNGTRAAGPVRAAWTRSTLGIVDAFFVRTAEDSRTEDHRADRMLLKEGKHLLANQVVIADIADFRDPLLHLAGIAAFAMNDADRYLRRADAIRSVERGRADGIALKATICLATEPVFRRAIGHGNSWRNEKRVHPANANYTGTLCCENEQRMLDNMPMPGKHRGHVTP